MLLAEAVKELWCDLSEFAEAPRFLGVAAPGAKAAASRGVLQSQVCSPLSRRCSVALTDLPQIWAQLTCFSRPEARLAGKTPVLRIDAPDEQDDVEEVARPFWERLPRLDTMLMMGSIAVPFVVLVPVGLIGSGPAALASIATGQVPLVLCGLTLNTKTMYELFGCCMAAGAWSMWNRHPDVLNRIVQRRSGIALGISSVVHLLLSAGLPLLGAPFDLAFPDIVMHILPNLFITPLIILNLGFLAGQNAQAMVPTVMFSNASVAAFVLAAATPVPMHGMTCMMVGSICLLKAAFDVDRTLPAQAVVVSWINKLRTQISADLLVFAWLGYPIVESLALVHAISQPLALQSFLVLDLLGQLGVSHLVLRSEQAIKSAMEYAAERCRESPETAAAA